MKAGWAMLTTSSRPNEIATPTDTAASATPSPTLPPQAIEPFLYNLICDSDIIDFPFARIARDPRVGFLVESGDAQSLHLWAGQAWREARAIPAADGFKC